MDKSPAVKKLEITLFWDQKNWNTKYWPPYFSSTGSPPFCKAITAYGIWDNMHVLLVSYLKNRKQFILWNDAKSQINTTQGDILQ